MITSDDALSSRTACPWCGIQNGVEYCNESFLSKNIADALSRLYERQGQVELDLVAKGRFRLKACGGCGLVYQVEIPTERFAERLYNVWIDPHKCFEVHERRKSINYYEGRVIKAISIVKLFKADTCDLRVLDYSMGWAQFAIICKSLGLNISGTEYTEEKRAYARRFGIDVADEHDLLEGSFDWVNADQVLEHVPEPRALFDRLCGWVRPGGILSLSVPYGDDILQRVATLRWEAEKTSPYSLMPVQPLEHINCFRRQILSSALLERGFQEVQVDQLSLMEGVYRDTRRAAGRLVRSLMGRRRPPITIDIVAMKR